MVVPVMCSSSRSPPVAASFQPDHIVDAVLNVEDAAGGGLQEPGIGVGVAGVDGQRLAADVGVDGAGGLVVERQIAIRGAGGGIADGALAGDDIVEVGEGLAGGGGDDLTAGAERDRAIGGGAVEGERAAAGDVDQERVAGADQIDAVGSGIRRAAVPADGVAGDVEFAAAAGLQQPGIFDAS